MHPVVSIIINNYNYSSYVSDAISSSLDQDFPSVEVIVVDDGSIDDSLVVIEKYRGRVQIVAKDNGGQGSAINAGFRCSRGDYILFLDSDDVLLPSAAESIKVAFSEPDVVKAHWKMVAIDQLGKPTGKLTPASRLASGDLRDYVLRKGPTNVPSSPMSGNAFRRGFLEKILPMDEPLFRQGADTYLFELAPFFGSIVHVKTPQGKYREHGGNYHKKMGIDFKLDRQLRFYDHICNWICRHLASNGVSVDLNAWNHSCWYKREAMAINQIITLAGDHDLILADNAEWDAGQIGSRARYSFTDNNGEYAGPPRDDSHAVNELERLRAAGAGSFAVAWPAFWYFDYYTDFKQYLDENYSCLLSNENIVIYGLAQSLKT